MKTTEQISRSTLKTITYRILIIITNAVVIYLITKRWDITAGFTTVTVFSNTFIYFLHERIWNKISWGKTKS